MSARADAGLEELCMANQEVSNNTALAIPVTRQQRTETTRLPQAIGDHHHG
jgi:hypothetical protein